MTKTDTMTPVNASVISKEVDCLLLLAYKMKIIDRIKNTTTVALRQKTHIYMAVMSEQASIKYFIFFLLQFKNTKKHTSKKNSVKV